eukprot:GHVS01034528.1.p1 GENE.GHVS01034528.1~~GHVS01034528.1.p1  ORF type:complete len:125 (+),score=23.39 GHVS01034528.1:64-438(+)
MESRLPGLSWLPLPSEAGRQQLQAEGRVLQAMRVAIGAQTALQLHPARHLWPLSVHQQLELTSAGGGCGQCRSSGETAHRPDSSSSDGSSSPVSTLGLNLEERPRQALSASTRRRRRRRYGGGK